VARRGADWLETDYPAIQAKARRQKGTIFWGDETGLRADDVRSRSDAPCGRAPVVRPCHKRANLGVISAVTNQGKLRWMGLDRLTPSPLRGTRRLRRAGSGGGRLGGRAILPRGRRGRARRARADVEIGGVAGGEAERQPGHVGLLLRGRSTFGGSRWQRSGKTKAAWVDEYLTRPLSFRPCGWSTGTIPWCPPH
jgi:hypothetical protein